jgi:hypothetical protein
VGDVAEALREREHTDDNDCGNKWQRFSMRNGH